MIYKLSIMTDQTLTPFLQTYQMALGQGFGSENKGAMTKVWENLLKVEVKKK